MRYRCFFFKIILLLSTFNLFSTIYSEMVFLEKTDFQFPVIRIEAPDDKNPVILIFGGIHGNEPGAYLTAEKLTDIKLLKGTLIVVPRVNFYSIMKNVRGYFGDMNRKFSEEELRDDPDLKIVKILKSLMSEAHVFLNLHDAWGFHRLYPKNFGECIIVDGARLYSPRWGKEFNLEEIGKRVVKNVNKRIKIKKHLFSFWNHETLKNRNLSQMKKSATFYAYYYEKIPAFGIETSKNIHSDELKVMYQMFILEEIFKEFGVEYKKDSISWNIPKPEIYYLKVNIGGIEKIAEPEIPLYVGDNKLFIVEKVVGNRKFGWSVDILGWGGENDIGKEYMIQKKTYLIVKNDYKKLKRFTVYALDDIPYIEVKINGEIKKIYSGEIYEVKESDEIVLLRTSMGNKIDFKGYAKKGKINRGNDVGDIIKYEKLQKEYALDSKERIYKVISRKGYKKLFSIYFKFSK